MSAPISNHSLTLHNENDLHYFLATPCENRASLSKLVLGPEGRGPAHDRRRALVIRDCSAFGAAILRSPSLATVKCENVRWASDDILGRRALTGTAEQIEARLLDELMALDKVRFTSCLRRLPLAPRKLTVATIVSNRMVLGEYPLIHRER